MAIKHFRRGLVVALALMLAVLPGVVSLLSPPLAQAWFSRKGKTEKSDAEKPLTQKQAKKIAVKLVNSLFADKWFKEDELARRVTLSLIQFDIANKEVTEREFTDMILNQLLGRSEVAVVNQEPQLSMESLNYSLVFYDDEWLARNRGLMLGAEYVITGRLSESLETDSKGRVYKTYMGRLAIKKMRSNDVVLERSVTQSRKKMKRKVK